MDSLSSPLFRPSDHISDQPIKGNGLLQFSEKEGLYLHENTPPGSPKNIDRVKAFLSGSSLSAVDFPNEEVKHERKTVYGVVMERINQRYGPEAASAFHAQFSNQRRAGDPLKLDDVQIFLHSFFQLIEDRGVVLDLDSVMAKELFEKSTLSDAPENSIIFTSKKITTREQSGLAVTEDFENCSFPESYIRILGAEERAALAQELMGYHDFAKARIPSVDFIKKELLEASSEVSETTSEGASESSKLDVNETAIEAAFEKKATNLALGVISRADWDRFELTVGDEKVVFSLEKARTDKGARTCLSTFKHAIYQLSGKKINDREAFEIMRLITSEGRLGGISSGANPKTGISFTVDQMQLEKPNPERIKITFCKKSQSYNIAYTPAQSYLKAITKPVVEMREDGTSVTIPKSTRFDIATDIDDDIFTFSEAEHNCPENVQRFETASTYTYELKPPASLREEGSVSIKDSRQAYWRVNRPSTASV